VVWGVGVVFYLGVFFWAPPPPPPSLGQSHLARGVPRQGLLVLLCAPPLPPWVSVSD
jgi:hypothetical protein